MCHVDTPYSFELDFLMDEAEDDQRSSAIYSTRDMSEKNRPKYA
jgi:hypothetical protein